MSVLIKDMEMPSCCGGCGFSDWSNLHQTLSCSKHYFEPCFEDYSKEYMEKRADFCPLIEIPEPHGDLIDRDAFRVDCGMGENCDKCENDSRNCEYDFIYTKMDFCGWIDDAPIVIEGSGSHADDWAENCGT